MSDAVRRADPSVAAGTCVTLEGIAFGRLEDYREGAGK